MNIPITLQSRMTSQRLPGKVLREVNGRPLLDYVISRLRRCQKTTGVMVATSHEETDDPIAAYCDTNNIRCFRGPLDNVLERYQQAIKEFPCDAVVRISGDSPVIDPAIVDTLVGIYMDGDYDLVTNVLERTFPKGQSVEVINAQTLLACEAATLSVDEREHVTRFFYNHPGEFKIFNVKAADGNYNHVQMCIDTAADLAHFENVLKQLDRPVEDYGWKDMLPFFNQEKAAA